MSITNWNTSKVKSMNKMFQNARNFKEDITGWDYDAVESMDEFLDGAQDFAVNMATVKIPLIPSKPLDFNTGTQISDIQNPQWGYSNANTRAELDQLIADWKLDKTNATLIALIERFDTSLITDFSYMDFGPDFNLDITGWNTASATTFEGMFQNARSFNQDISGWSTLNVTTMAYMFDNARSFNYSVNGWSTTAVNSMKAMFKDAHAYNQDMELLDVSNVINMAQMFQNAKVFDGNVSSWNVSRVRDTSYMFDGASAFNGVVNSWTFSALNLKFQYMFKDAVLFDQPMTWNLQGTGRNMEGMFQGALAFNDPSVLAWTMTTVTNVSKMFLHAESFNRDIASNWDISLITSSDDFASNSAMQPEFDPFTDTSVSDGEYDFEAQLIASEVTGQSGEYITTEAEQPRLVFFRADHEYDNFVRYESVKQELGYILVNGYIGWKPPVALTAGFHTFELVSVNEEGVELVKEIKLEIGNTIPESAILSLDSASDDGTFNDDNITTVQRPTFIVTNVPANAVTVEIKNTSGLLIGEATKVGDNYTFTPSSDLPYGQASYEAVITDDQSVETKSTTLTVQITANSNVNLTKVSANMVIDSDALSSTRTTSVRPSFLITDIDAGATGLRIHKDSVLFANVSLVGNNGADYTWTPNSDLEFATHTFRFDVTDGSDIIPSDDVVIEVYNGALEARTIAGYAPSWGHTELNTENSKFRNIPNEYGSVLIAFLKPDLPAFTENTPLADYGLDFGSSMTWADLKADIQFMQSQGKKVYFSVGGATYFSGLPQLEAEGEDIITNNIVPNGLATPTIYTLNQILQYTGADGLDVDWEQTELNGLVVDDTMFWRLYTFTRALRAACDMGSGGFKLGIASFSTSWDQTATTLANTQSVKGISGDANSTLVGWYGGNAGQARGAASFEYNGQTYNDWLDWLDFIYIMSYDVGQDGYHDSAGRAPSDPNFNTGGHNTIDNDHYSAIQAHKECIYVLEAMGKADIPVSIGLEPSPEGAGKATLMVRDSYCNSGAAIMVKDQYQREINMPHSVENYATYIEGLTTRPNDGYMVWSLWKNDYSPVVARLPNTNPIEEYANDTNMLAEITRVRNL